MALADWNFYDTGTGMALSIDTTTPQIGTGSGRIDWGDGTSSLHGAIINPTTLSGRDKGLTTGKYRTVLSYSTGISNLAMGFIFQQSVEDVVGSTGNFYAAVFSYQTTLGLYKITGESIQNVAFSGPLATATAPAQLQTATNDFTFEVEWITDVTSLGGVLIYLRTGTATDYSDLAQRIVYTDTTSPFTTSVAESFFVARGGAADSTASIVFRLDNTTLYKL